MKPEMMREYVGCSLESRFNPENMFCLMLLERLCLGTSGCIIGSGPTMPHEQGDPGVQGEPNAGCGDGRVGCSRKLNRVSSPKLD